MTNNLMLQYGGFKIQIVGCCFHKEPKKLQPMLLRINYPFMTKNLYTKIKPTQNLLKNNSQSTVTSIQATINRWCPGVMYK